MGNGMLTAGQEDALRVMKSGQNMFLTGEAGTGKTFVLREFLADRTNEGMNVMVCAPTGVAALQAGGVTLHRAFKLTLGVLEDRERRVPQTVRAADIIVIDEVSMCRYDTFRAVGRMILGMRKRPQVIVVGDFLQLPPVIAYGDGMAMTGLFGRDGYRNGWCFETVEWSRFDFRFVELTEVVRQKDREFIQNLNLARVGDAGCAEYFNQRVGVRVRAKDSIRLLATNAAVQKANDAALARLKGKRHEYKTVYSGNAKPSDTLCDQVLKIKVGARVMGLVNTFDKKTAEPTPLFMNGSLGTVDSISSNGVITVDWDDFGKCRIRKNTWEVNNYEIHDANGVKTLSIRKTGEVRQYPIKLAYAITVHKSQGQTFGHVMIDPTNCRTNGQLYVALSRCTSFRGMGLVKPVTPRNLSASAEVIDWLDDLRNGRPTAFAPDGGFDGDGLFGAAPTTGTTGADDGRGALVRVPNALVGRVNDMVAKYGLISDFMGRTLVVDPDAISEATGIDVGEVRFLLGD